MAACSRLSMRSVLCMIEAYLASSLAFEFTGNVIFFGNFVHALSHSLTASHPTIIQQPDVSFVDIFSLTVTLAPGERAADGSARPAQRKRLERAQWLEQLISEIVRVSRPGLPLKVRRLTALATSNTVAFEPFKGFRSG